MVQNSCFYFRRLFLTVAFISFLVLHYLLHPPWNWQETHPPARPPTHPPTHTYTHHSCAWEFCFGNEVSWVRECMSVTWCWIYIYVYIYIPHFFLELNLEKSERAEIWGCFASFSTSSPSFVTLKTLISLKPKVASARLFSFSDSCSKEESPSSFAAPSAFTPNPACFTHFQYEKRKAFPCSEYYQHKRANCTRFHTS